LNGRICLSPKCNIYKIKTICNREQFFRSHVMKKSTEDIVSVLENIGLKIPFRLLGRYTILNIFTDLCESKIAESILYERFEVK